MQVSSPGKASSSLPSLLSLLNIPVSVERPKSLPDLLLLSSTVSSSTFCPSFVKNLNSIFILSLELNISVMPPSSFLTS